jgi:hypothetical protein
VNRWSKWQVWERSAYQVKVGKREGKSDRKNLGADGNNIKMDLREIIRDGVESICMAYDTGESGSVVLGHFATSRKVSDFDS